MSQGLAVTVDEYRRETRDRTTETSEHGLDVFEANLSLPQHHTKGDCQLVENDCKSGPGDRVSWKTQEQG